MSNLDDDVCPDDVEPRFPKQRLDLECPECQAFMRLLVSKHGPFYGCTRYPLCKSTHGAHPDGAPLGIPAKADTKEWRVKAHKVFDQIWKDEYLTRTNAYCWMQRALDLPEDEAHIGRFDIGTCKLLIERVQEDFPDLDFGDLV